MPAWSQAKGGPLSDQEIDDLVAFVLALPVTNLQPAQPEAGATVQAPGLPGWVQGVAGLVLFFLALIIVIGGILLFQRRS